VVVQIDGQAVGSDVGFMRQVAALKPGASTALQVLRGAQSLSIKVAVEQRPTPPAAQTR
jgi:S1-C subfamily serine protease